MKKRKLRKKIADTVATKMYYMAVCPNERDTILNIILSKKDRYSWNVHCDTDCANTNCNNYKFGYKAEKALQEKETE